VGGKRIFLEHQQWHALHSIGSARAPAADSLLPNRMPCLRGLASSKGARHGLDRGSGWEGATNSLETPLAAGAVTAAAIELGAETGETVESGNDETIGRPGALAAVEARP